MQNTKIFRTAAVVSRGAARFAIMICLCLSLGQAQAQPKPADSKAEAERFGKEGERLLSQHDTGAAIEHLQRAFNLSKNPKFLLPLGMAYAEGERPLDALDALGRFLKDAPALPDSKRKEIGGKLQIMLDQVAALVVIEASRENAPIKVDGRPVGSSPLESPLRLMPGKHEFIMQPAPTDPSSGAKVVIDVRPGERRTVKLEPGARSRFLEPQSQNEPDDPAQVKASQAPVKIADAGHTEGKPIYKKWWFWAGIGGATAVVLGLAIGLGTGGNSRPPVVGTDPDAATSAGTWQGGTIDARSATLAIRGLP